jgi:hypothetical protein
MRLGEGGLFSPQAFLSFSEADNFSIDRFNNFVKVFAHGCLE